VGADPGGGGLGACGDGRLETVEASMDGFWWGFLWGAVSFGTTTGFAVWFLGRVTEYVMGVDRASEQENKRGQFK
jgi:hypothetical protein